MATGVSPYESSYVTQQINGSTPLPTAGRLPQLLTHDGQRIGVLRLAYDIKITDEILNTENGSETLDFSLPLDDAMTSIVANEQQVQISGSRFKIRTTTAGVDDSGNRLMQVHAEALWYDLGTGDGVLVNPGTTSASTAIATLVAGTGWVVGAVQAVSGGTFTMTTRATPLAGLRNLPGIFGGELWFDNINRTVNLVSVRGDQSGNRLYVAARNLSAAQRVTDTTQLTTRVRPVGANSLDISSVNGGVYYLEDYSYYDSIGATHQVQAQVISNDQITSPTALLAWGRAQLAVLSQPKYTYNVTPAQLATETVPALGDRVRVVDKAIGLNVWSRVASRVYCPLEPAKSTLSIDTAAYTLAQQITSVPGSSLTNAGSQTGATVPSPPSGLSVSTSQSVDPDGHMYTYATITWAAPTTNSDGSPLVDLNNYEVQYSIDSGAWIPLGRTSEVNIQTPPFHATASIVARVQAWTLGGNNSGWVQSGVTAVKDTVAPPTPSAPTLSNRLPLALEVSWNGLDATQHVMPSDFARVEVHVSPVSAFTPSSGSVAPRQLLPASAQSMTSATGWNTSVSGAAAPVVDTTTPAHSGGQSLKYTTPASGTSGSSQYYYQTGVGPTYSGDVVTWGVWVRPSVALTMRNYLVPFAGAQSLAITVGQSLTCPAGQWTFVQAQATMPIGTTSVLVELQSLTPMVSGTTLNIDDASVSAQGTATLQAEIDNYVGGIGVVTQLDPLTTYWVALRAVDRTGNVSAFTVPVSGQVAQLQGPHYQALSITDAAIGSVSAGKITVGQLNADVTVSARIKTSDTGARVELNSGGLQSYDASGAQTVNIGSDGTVSIQGDTTTRRDSQGRYIAMQLNTDGEPAIAFAGPTGNSYLYIPSITVPTDDDLGLIVETGTLNVSSSSLSFYMSNENQQIAVLTSLGGAGGTNLFRVTGPNGPDATMPNGAVQYWVPRKLATGQCVQKFQLTPGSYSYITNTYGTTMLNIPTVQTTLDAGTYTPSGTIGFITTTNYRQYASSFTAGGAYFYMHSVANAYL